MQSLGSISPGTLAGRIGLACALVALIIAALFIQWGSDLDRALLLTYLWLLASVAALGCGAVGLLRARRGAGNTRRIALVALVAGVILLLACDRVALRRLRQMSGHMPCAENLGRIGMALAMYAEANGGRYPADLESLAISGAIDANALICPGGNDRPARGTTAAALAAEFKQAGHVSFVYLGKGKHASDFAADDVLAYDRATDHDGTGSNILCGDYHVEWVPTRVLNHMLAQPHLATRPSVSATSQTSP